MEAAPAYLQMHMHRLRRVERDMIELHLTDGTHWENVGTHSEGTVAITAHLQNGKTIIAPWTSVQYILVD
jgi:hypothetical protein